MSESPKQKPFTKYLLSGFEDHVLSCSDPECHLVKIIVELAMSWVNEESDS